MNWHSAVRRCMDFKSHLVIIENKKEQDLFRGMNFENVFICIIGLYSTFSVRGILPLHNIPSPRVLIKSIEDRMHFLTLTTCVGCCIK